MSDIFGGFVHPLPPPHSAIVSNRLTPLPSISQCQHMTDTPSPFASNVKIWLTPQPPVFGACQYLARPLMKATVIFLAKKTQAMICNYENLPLLYIVVMIWVNYRHMQIIPPCQ